MPTGRWSALRWTVLEGGPIPGALDARTREAILAAARLFLSASAFIAIYLDPTEPAVLAPVAYTLLAAYVVTSTAVFVLVRSRRQIGARLPLLLHWTDIACARAISLLTSGPGTAFFIFYAFVILAAAFRWGLRETLWTTAVLMAVLVGQALVLGLEGASGVLGGGSQLNRVIMRCVHLLILGFFTGYLGDKEKEAEFEGVLVGAVTRELRADISLQQAAAAILGRLVDAFDAERGVVVLQELASGRILLGQLAGCGRGCELDWRELSREEASPYLFPIPGTVARVPAQHARMTALALDETGRALDVPVRPAVPSTVGAETATAWLVADLPAGDEWRARAILIDPSPRMAGRYAVQLLYRLARHVGPVMDNVFLIDRRRTRATARERARVAREIHDSSLQGLAGIELQLQALEQQATAFPAVAAETTRIRDLVHAEVLNLRDLIRDVHLLEVRPQDLPDAILDLGERFQRETGITVQFATDGAEVDFPPTACREVVRIVQEALTNVRKHSGARHAAIRLERQDSEWKLTVDDDGSGFDFSGEMGLDALDRNHRGPRVIKQRARLLGAALTVRSVPGTGARLEIRIPTAAVTEDG